MDCINVLIYQLQANINKEIGALPLAIGQSQSIQHIVILFIASRHHIWHL